jgi:hypothetical protein
MGTTALSANFALAIEDTDGIIGIKMVTSRMAQELQSRAARLGSSAGTSDTTWVGYTPGFQNNVNNYWSIYAGFGKDGFKRPVNGQPDKGVWNFDAPVMGDSLQGWWPQRMAATEFLGGDNDGDRPHTCLDFGNQANYVINESRGANWQNRATGTEAGWRTLGVDGIWHRDGGSLQVAAGKPAPTWAPLQGTASAWMGLRAHGDNTVSDPLTRNPFNEDVLVMNQVNAARASGTDKRFPGYASQLDQMLYRDIDFAGKTSSNLRVRFNYRTNMSTTALATSRFGWFNHDPLGVPSTSNQLNNFISGMLAGVANAPADSFMVYVGAGVDGQQWRGSDGVLRDVYDKKHRWFAEVLHSDMSFANPANPQPTRYKQILSVAGDVATTLADITIPNAALAPFLATNNKIRLVFRVKTNLFFDDERTGGRTYSSNGAGAAVVDDVRYQIGANSEVAFGTFEDVNSINNDPNVSALDAWKSTGKPPAIYHHIEQLTNVLYQDICGQKGDVTRICNLAHGIISQGDHDNGEAAGGDIVGGAERDRREGIVSPTIRFVDDDGNPNTKNPHGLYGNSNPFAVGNGGVGDVDATEDYYLSYDMYSGIYDGNNGNFWRFAFFSYPCNVTDAVPVYPAWGQMRQPGFIFFQPIGRICFQDLQGARQYGLLRHSNASGIPDSMMLQIQKVQLCYAFGVPSGCSPRDGAYIDNVSLALVDGVPAQLSVDIWQWIQDAFPANETTGFPGNAALFDTTSAIVKTGLNIAQDTNNPQRYTVPGDSIAINSSVGTARMDMVFRVLPGPGNYQPIGDGHNGNLRRVPTSAATVTVGDGSWWDVYRTNPGEFATNPAGMTGLKAGWNPNFWLSARCDTADANIFALQGRGITGGPLSGNTWMSTYHESDKRFNALGILKNRCFVIDPTGPLSNIICDGTVPAWAAGAAGTTREFTKIIPDGILTPGAHVQYFFRDQKDTAVPGPYDGLCPDTTVVFPQITEGPSFDAHRWQEFSVLPDRWKDPAYLHPVFQTFGRGPACLLVVDWNDRRGDERVWVSVADTIGATAVAKFGAHNGWHAPGTTNPVPDANDINAPAYRVAQHGGSPGTTWDMYQIKASESIDTGAGTLGSRLSYSGGDPLLANKRARNAPTPEMLDAYYTLMLILTGDLNSNIFGPFLNKTDNDVGIITGWLENGNSAVQDRGIWMIGDGAIEANTLNATELSQLSLALDYFRADLVDRNFQQFANVSDPVVDLRVFPEWQGKDVASIYGMRNVCTWTNDVLQPSTPLLTSVTSQYEKKGAPVNGYYAGVFKDWDPSFPWKSLVDGWDLIHLTSRNDINTVGRSTYFYKVFTNVWSKIWNVAGTPVVPLDVQSFDDGSLINFVNVMGNPMYASAKAKIRFGLAKRDRASVYVYDVGGRLIRTLADREFAAGTHEVEWDGLDNGGRQVARGVYFTQIQFQKLGYKDAKKITVLQ